MREPLHKLTKKQLIAECARRQRLIGKLSKRPTWDQALAKQRRIEKDAKDAMEHVDSRLRNMHQNIETAESRMRTLAADNFIMRKKLKKAGIPHA